MAADEYAKYLARARKQFIQGHAATLKQVEEVYTRTAAQIAKDISRVTPGTLRHSHLVALQSALDARARSMSKDVLAAAHQGIWRSSQAASTGVVNIASQQLAGVFERKNIKSLFAAVNERATLAMLARTRQDGLKISDRVWRTSEVARNNITRIIEDAVARGQDARTTARQVQRYLQPGVWTAHKAETRRRLGVSKDVSYEAMRLTRTEMNNAFHEGMIAANYNNPAYTGILWRLSPAHVVPDICTDMARDLSFGVPGFYPKGLEPVRPHPQCMCAPIPAYEDLEQFKRRLIEWRDNPASHTDIDAWYSRARNFIGSPAAVALSPLQKAVWKAEAEISTLPYERAYVFDSDGVVLLAKDGGKDYVAFSVDERTLMKDSIFTHNHPTIGGSFSIDDIRMAAASDVSEMRAVGKTYFHSMTRPKAGWPHPDQLEFEYRMVEEQVKKEFVRKIELGQMSPVVANAEHHHTVWLRVTETLGIQYTRGAR